jgi:nucleotide-binding universal stress UspA family protein
MLAGFANALAESHHSHLTLLHVLDCAGMTEQEREVARCKAQLQLSWLVPKEARSRHQGVVLTQEGEPTSFIPAAISSMSQDLIILGAPFPSLISWILGTSVVHRVIEEAECPVLTIKYSAGSDTSREVLYDSVDSEGLYVQSSRETQQITLS